MSALYLELGRFDLATDYERRASRIARENKSPLTEAISFFNLAKLLYAKGKYKKALSLYEKALLLAEGALGQYHLQVAEIVHCIGTVYHRLGDYRAAR